MYKRQDEVFAYVVIDGKADLPYEEGAMIPVAPPVQEKVSKAPVVSQPVRTCLLYTSIYDAAGINRFDRLSARKLVGPGERCF